MNDLLLSLKIQVNDKIYVKDPETSSLGRKIIQESIILIDEIGFENFLNSIEQTQPLNFSTLINKKIELI